MNEITRCPSCVHMLNHVELGPCKAMTAGTRLDGVQWQTECGCTHISHYTKEVIQLD